MQVEELIKKAWSAVKQADVPEALQAVALKEAIDILREGDHESISKPTPKARRSRRKRDGNDSSDKSSTADLPDEETFLSQLAHESGVKEEQLGDVLRLTGDGEVHVTQPARQLGTSVRQQAQRAIALVASARGKGLGEKPVSMQAVRSELDRIGCYNGANFSNNHLGSLKGFNKASRDEIVLTSKWIGEFKAAIAAALGEDADGGD